MDPTTATAAAEWQTLPDLADLVEVDGAQPLALGEALREREDGVALCMANQQRLGRNVVVQIPADDTNRARRELRGEATLLAGLDHPNILPVHDVISVEDTLQVLVPDVPGRSWADRLNQPHLLRERFGATDVLAWHVRVLVRVCRAVEFAHERDIIHRDLRPDAVWVGDVGEVYLADWALATPATHAMPLSPRELARGGRAAWFAPEMVMRSAGRVGPRTDVYQLGGLLYRVLTGQAPHPEDDVDEAIKHVLFRDPALPHDAPPSLSRVCKRALARNPAARHPGVKEFREDLERAFAQRGAWDLAHQADASFDQLRRLAASGETRREDLHRAYGAVRLGYEQAMVDAELASARVRLDRSAELVVRWELLHGDVDGARALLLNMTEPLQHLLDEVEEAARAPAAPSPRDSRLPWAATLLGISWIPAPLVGLLVPDGALSLPAMIGAAVVATALAAVTQAVLPRFGGTDARTRRLLGLAFWGPAAMAALLATAWGLGVEPVHARPLATLGAFAVVGIGAFVIDTAALGAALVFAATFLLCLVLPWAWGIGMLVGNLALLTTLVLRAGGSGGR